MKYLPLVSILCLVGCGPFPESATEKEANKQEQLLMNAVQSVGMPGIVEFGEKRQLKDLLELRDHTPATYTYLVGMNNHIVSTFPMEQN